MSTLKYTALDVLGVVGYIIFILPDFWRSASLLDFSVLWLVLFGITPAFIGLLMALPVLHRESRVPGESPVAHFFLKFFTPFAVLGLSVSALHLVGYVFVLLEKNV